MAKKSNHTKSRIVKAAWKLFYEQGYDDTTVDEIIAESGTSKGSFYHYFEGKDALLSSLSYMFDEKYAEIKESLDNTQNSFDKLLYMNEVLFDMIDNEINIDLLARLYSSQLVTKGDKHMLDYNREYYKLLRKVISEGQDRGEITAEMSVNDIVKLYAMCERGLMYDWCIRNGEYSLKKYAKEVMPMLLSGLKM